jgi:hypothetical protein
MTLLDAFRLYGPAFDESPESEVRSKAAEVLLAELRRLAGRMPARPEQKEDAISTVSYRLVRNGPRGLRVVDPQSDEGVVGYLHNALRNVLVSHHRDDRRLAGGDGVVDIPDPGDPEKQLAARQLAEQLAKTTEFIDSELIPAARDGLARRDAREAFVRSIQQLRLLADGGATMNDFIVEEYAEVTVATRNAILKRHSRARRQLMDEIERRAQSGELAGATLDSVLRLVEPLRRRSDAAGSNDRTAQPRQVRP